MTGKTFEMDASLITKPVATKSVLNLVHHPINIIIYVNWYLFFFEFTVKYFANSLMYINSTVNCDFSGKIMQHLNICFLGKI